MKMAKATEQDIETALVLSTFLGSLGMEYVPLSALVNEYEDEYLDTDNGEQCCRIVKQLLQICQYDSVERVAWGMATICDPRNEFIDPDADTLEIHPKHLKAARQRDALLSALSLISTDKDGDGFVCREAVDQVREAIQFAEGKES